MRINISILEGGGAHERHQLPAGRGAPSGHDTGLQ
jgi:hypothetical protein